MKKKQKKKVTSTKASVSKKLYFLLEGDLPEQGVAEWLDFVQSSRQELQLLVLPPQSANNDAAWAPFLEAEEVTIISPEGAGQPIPNLVAAKTGVGTDVFLCRAHWEKLAEAKQMAAIFNQSQGKITSSHIAIPVVEESPNLARKAAFFFSELFFPIGLYRQLAGMPIVPAKKVADWLAHTEGLQGVGQSKQLVAKSLEFDPAAVVLPVKMGETAKGASMVGASFKAFFQDFSQKFITGPLAEFKERKLFPDLLKDGNSGLYRFSFFAISLLLFLLMPLMSFDYGMTWDEPVLVEYAEDIYKYYASGGEDKSVFDMKKHARNATMHYSASFDLLAHLLHKYISPFGIYETRHLLNALVGAMLMLFIGRLGSQLGNWRIALVALLFAVLSPRLFGHSMNNPKDIPFALGYAMSLYYMLRFFRQLPKPHPGTFFWLIASMAFILSIKIGGLLVIGYLGLLGGMVWLYGAYQDGFAKALGKVPRYALFLAILIIPSYFLGILFWPWGIEKPFENPITSLTEFTNFRFLITYELFEGERINMDSPPPHYTFKWIGISVPLFVLAGFFLSLVALSGNAKKFKTPARLMFLFALFFPVAYTIIQNSTLYSGWRHLMFVYVPMVALAASGWEFLLQMARPKALKLVTAGAMAVLLVLPASWMVRNHPNEYVYFNELVGGINGAYMQYETEYWCNSMKQAVEWLVENEPVEEKRTYVAANFEITTGQYYANKLTDSLQMLWTRENEKYKQRWNYAFFGTRGMSQEMIKNTFPPKGTIHVIKADSVPLLAIVKRENFFLPEANDLQRQGRLREALDKVLQAIEYEPTNVEALRQGGLLYLNMGQDQEAVNLLSQCLQLNPDDYVAYMLIGIASYNQKDYEKAVPYLQKSVALKVNNSSGYHHLGRTLTAMGDFEQALKYFEQAVKYDNGRNPAIFFDAALALMQQGLKYPSIKQNRFELAIRNLQLAIDKNPNMLEAYQNLAYAYQELGDEAMAQKYMALFQQRQGG